MNTVASVTNARNDAVKQHLAALLDSDVQVGDARRKLLLQGCELVEVRGKVAEASDFLCQVNGNGSG